jgi:DNA-binding MarR family transcriptional regulator
MNRPIGYWIKLLDRLIDESFEAAIGAEGLTRRHWQALNVIRSGPVDAGRMDAELAAFLTGEAPTTGPVLDDLRARGWVADDAGRLSLTPAGTTAYAALAERVGANRARIARGVSEADYATTVATLTTMCANLQPTP